MSSLWLIFYVQNKWPEKQNNIYSLVRISSFFHVSFLVKGRKEHGEKLIHRILCYFVLQLVKISNIITIYITTSIK